jgi:uncharacterized protein
VAAGPVAAATNAWRALRWVFLAIAFAAASVAWAVPWEAPKDGLQPVPALTSPVTDLTGTLSAAERQALDAKLRDWQARTTNQLVVLVIATTAPESIEDYSIRVADAWKIGQKGVDNGAIFLVAKDDKRLRIEVGYGFEGVLTDVTSRRIIAETVAPLFKQGQFAAGINAGVDRIIAVVQDGKPLPPLSGATSAPGRKSSGGNFDYGTLFIVLLVAVPVVGGILRSMFGNVFGSIAGAGIAGVAAWFVAGSLIIAGLAGIIAFIIIIFSMFGGGRGGFIPGGFGGGGGGFGGGGGGGFSGGGGGFGGGGASGGWD